MPQRLTPALRRIFSPSDRRQPLAEIARTAGEMTALSRELLRGSTEGAQQSSGQRDRIVDVVAMEARIRHSAEKTGMSSREAASRAEAVARETERGSEDLALTARHMQQMADTVASSVALMQQFVLRVSEVDSMVATIGEIARQTNLLALNAAIEAANAGKKGDGFSVIAHEIRLLADRTSKSTVDIGDSIETMCTAARDTEAALSKGKLAVDRSIQQTLGLQRSFQALRDVLQRVEGMAAEGSIASERQLASVNRVAQSVHKIDGLALGCTHEADASAEISVRMAACAVRLQEELARLDVPVPRSDEYELESVRELLGKMAAHQPRVDHAIQLLREKCAEAGEPSMVPGGADAGTTPPTLHLGKVGIAETNPWLDSIADATNCLAAILLCTGKGGPEEQFLDVATSLKRSDGSRALGTTMNPKSAAVRKLLAKQPYRGVMYAFGKPFLAAYEPLIAAGGRLVGAIYAGHPIG